MASLSEERFARLFAALDSQDITIATQQLDALRREAPSDARLGDAAARFAALAGNYDQIVPHLTVAANVPAVAVTTTSLGASTASMTTILDPPDRHALRAIAPGAHGRTVVRDTTLANADWSGLHLAGLAFMRARSSRLVIGDARLDSTWWEDCEWNGVDFSRGQGEAMVWGGSRWAGVVANGARLAQSRWHGHKFTSCQFMNADFSDAILSETRFDSCELLGAHFRGSVLVKVRFDHGVMSLAPLGQVDFRGAWLIDCDLTHADLYGADFTGAVIVNTAVHPGTELGGATVLSRSQRGSTDA